jgi:hypothetical protein
MIVLSIITHLAEGSMVDKLRMSIFGLLDQHIEPTGERRSKGKPVIQHWILLSNSPPALVMSYKPLTRYTCQHVVRTIEHAATSTRSSQTGELGCE